jgi:AraC-like DNA-binding protein
MITTTEIAPTAALAPFIRSYTYREFDTHGINIIKPWHASQNTNIIFFFKDLPTSLTDTITGKVLKRGKNCDIVGMSTKYNGDMTFNGKYSFLQIIFQPHGFYTLFDFAPIEISDQIVWSGDIFNSEITLLHEQLYEAKNVQNMAKLANVWLLQYLINKNNKIYNNVITATANLITKNAGLVNLESLTHYACMSKRNFERIFTRETGMSPKHLCCICRFNNALERKLNNPSMNWTTIAHQSGYFDQMHLIKDFKRFCGEAPSSLLKHVPLLEETYLSRISP